MNKKDRQIVFNKYGGKCAYCGCELVKGWHVDELLPVKRKWKYLDGYWKKRDKPITQKEVNTLSEEFMINEGVVWVERRKVSDGYEHPERLNIDNQMPACAPCNLQKHSQSLEGFRQSIAQFVNSLNSYHNQYKFAKRYGLVVETNKPVVFYFETLNQTA
jgi:5-methylcytosine-specific restriction endonuclease McrA